MNMGYKQALENRKAMRAEREWRIFESEGMLRTWMCAMAHQRIGVCVMEKCVTPVCVRVLVEYC